MMFDRMLVPCLAGLAICAAAQPVSDTQALRWHPKAGDAYEAKLTVRSGADKTLEEMEGVVGGKVTAVSETGYSLETWSKGFLVKGPGGEVRDERPNKRVDKYNSDGSLARIVSGPNDLGAYRLSLLLRFVAPPVPVKQGEAWRYDRKPDRPKGVPGVSIDYTFLGTENGLAKISFEFAETSGEIRQSAKGTWWIKPGGIPAKVEADVQNFLGVAGRPAKIVWERVA